MSKGPEIVVVGAGAIGVATAYYLSKSGVRVILIDEDIPGSGTTRATFGYINAVQKRPEHYHRFSRMGLEAFEALAQALGPEAGFGEHGALYWPSSWPDGQAGLEALVRELEGFDYPHRLLTFEEARALEPNVRVRGSDGPVLYLPIERWIDMDRLIHALIRRATDQGATLIPSCPVHELIVRGTKVIGVSTSKGFVASDMVVMAAGTASVGLLSPLGFHLALDRVSGALVLTSPLPGALRRVVYMGSYHIRPTGTGQMVIGSPEVDELVDESADVQAFEAWGAHLLQLAQKDVIGLDGANVLELRVGVRPIPRDGLPIIGHVPGVTGAYAAVMHSAVTLAAIVGQTVAEEVIKDQMSPVLEPYRPDRLSLSA